MNKNAKEIFQEYNLNRARKRIRMSVIFLVRHAKGATNTEDDISN